MEKIFTPTKKQVDFLRADKKVKFWQGGRGSGATTTLLLNTYYYKDVVWIGWSEPKIRELKYIAKSLFKEAFQKNFKNTPDSLSFGNTTINFVTPDSPLIDSSQPDLWVIDELTTPSILEVSEELYNTLLEKQGDIAISFTPVPDSFKFWEWLKEESEKRFTVQASVFDNPTLAENKEYITMLEKFNNIGWLKGEWEQ